MQKTKDKAHLDVTHYQSITDDEVEKIEKESNKIVKEKIPVHSVFIPRDKAEKKYGMAIYQGGAVPGKELRIVEIPEIDVECCGGTHLKNTSEAEEIKILGTTKIQDGVVRITFTSGRAAKKEEKKEVGILTETAKLLNCSVNQVPARAEELFKKWKSSKKAAKKGKELKKEELELSAKEEFKGDLIAKTAEIIDFHGKNIRKDQIGYIEDLAVQFLKDFLATEKRDINKLNPRERARQEEDWQES